MPIELVSHEAKAAQLVAEGLSRRPELAESRSLVAEAVDRLDREQYAPLCPACFWMSARADMAADQAPRWPTFAGDSISTPPHIGNSATSAWVKRPPARPPARGSSRPGFPRVRLMDRVAREIVEANTQARISPRPDRRGPIGNSCGERVLPAEPGANPRRSRIAVGSAPVDPSPRPKPPRIPAGSRRL